MAIILLTPYYSEHFVPRKKELDDCLALNVCNPLISKIILVCDETVPEQLSFGFDKVTMHRLGKRATFSDMFYRIAPKYVTNEDIVIIANSDIYFDKTLSKLKYIDWEKEIALALSRWDKVNGKWECYPTWDSQDVWVFKGAIKPMFAEFNLGLAGCDNRIAYEIDNAGYWIFNPSKEIVCRHIHETNYRTYDRSNVVSQPYKLLMPHDLSSIKMKRLPKIFHIGLTGFRAEEAIGGGLSKIGEYKFINWMPYFTNNNGVWEDKDRKKFEEMCINGAASNDIVFMQIQTDGIMPKALLKKMKQANPIVKLVNWTGDVRSPLPHYLVDMASECVTMVSNETDVEELRRMGFKAEYLQIAFDHFIYTPKGHKEQSPEIVFMGQNYYDEENGWAFPNGENRFKMVQFLKETYGDRFGVYGGGWKGLENAQYVNDPFKEAATYRGAKIAINYSHFDYKRYSSDRIFRIMGCGTMCLTHNYPDIEKDFTIGKHLAVFNDFAGMKNTIDYFLEHEKERQLIAEEGCKYVHKECTWDERIKQMIKLL